LVTLRADPIRSVQSKASMPGIGKIDRGRRVDSEESSQAVSHTTTKECPTEPARAIGPALIPGSVTRLASLSWLLNQCSANKQSNAD
jgi:hypothetical protein